MWYYINKVSIMNYKNCTTEELENHLKIIGRSLNEEEVDDLRENKSAFIYYISNSSRAFALLSEEERDNKELVWAAIKSHPSLIRYASDRIKDDDEIIKYCVVEKASSLKYASPRLLNDKNLIMESIKKSPFAFSYFSEKMKDNEEIFLIGTEHSSFIYEYASNRIKNDMEIMKKMCEQNFYFLLNLDFFLHKKDWIAYIYEHPKFKEFDASMSEEKGILAIADQIEILKTTHLANENEKRLFNLLEDKKEIENNITKKKI